MEAMRESWTDDRMDDLNGKVDALRLETKAEFTAVRGEVKEEFAAVRTEMREGFERIEKRFDKIDERFDKIDARFEKVDERFEKVDERFEEAEVRRAQRFDAMMDRLYSMQRQMIQVYVGLFTALFVAIAGLIATRL
jgi:predicted nuclease with TOPRIM domain